ncbi:MAG TPA: NAD-dependent epimerase/dehydratase family protein [Vicinamibacteria bacterium]|nr:NAD-dependent epimerase/dehydratase family protein [Vicinamibacteria bacterium]
MAERLAVTGANGFVGRHVTALAARRGWAVAGIVRSAAAATAVADAGGAPVVVPGLAGEPLARALAGARAVVHLAHIGAERDGATYEAVNVAGTRRVVAAAGEAGVPRVVLFSGLGVARYGQAPRVTNRYFLSKLSAELELFRSDREAVVFRPSYIVGPGDGLTAFLVDALARGGVEVPGDGAYRMQPVFVEDAVEAVLVAAGSPGMRRPGAPPHRVVDLVGPEPVSYRDLIAAVARTARALGRTAHEGIRQVALAEAERRARGGGFQGLGPDDFDCLVCDEVADPAPLEALLGRELTPLAAALEAAVRGVR